MPHPAFPIYILYYQLQLLKWKELCWQLSWIPATSEGNIVFRFSFHTIWFWKQRWWFWNAFWSMGQLIINTTLWSENTSNSFVTEGSESFSCLLRNNYSVCWSTEAYNTLYTGVHHDLGGVSFKNPQEYLKPQKQVITLPHCLRTFLSPPKRSLSPAEAENICFSLMNQVRKELEIKVPFPTLCQCFHLQESKVQQYNQTPPTPTSGVVTLHHNVYMHLKE